MTFFDGLGGGTFGETAEPDTFLSLGNLAGTTSNEVSKAGRHFGGWNALMSRPYPGSARTCGEKNIRKTLFSGTLF